MSRYLKAEILCPQCDEPSIKVITSRGTVENEIWRRRECENGHRWSTIETTIEGLRPGIRPKSYQRIERRITTETRGK